MKRTYQSGNLIDQSSLLPASDMLETGAASGPKSRCLAAVVCGLVATLSLARPGDAQSALVGYWNFNEGSLLTANDSSGNGNTGTLQGTPNVPTWVAGHTGMAGDYAIHFDQGRVRVPNSPSLQITNQFTLTSWIYDVNSFYGHIFVAGADAGGTGRQWLLQTSNSGADSAYFWSDTTGAFQRTLNFIPSQNAWHHLAVTYDNNRIRTYQDGILKSTSAAFSASLLTTWTSLKLGGHNNFGQGFEKWLDDMGVFSDVQSPQRIALISGLGQPSFGVALNDSAIDSVLAVFNTQSGSAVAGGVTWEYATGLPESTVGETGGSLAGNDAYIVLGSNIDGGLGVQMVVKPAVAVPEASTIVLASCGLLGLLACAWRKKDRD